AALRVGRRPPLLAASAAFVACWGLKLAAGPACLLAARIFAGLAGAAAWTAAPLYGREISSGAVRGAASAAPVLAHNVGFLLMYAAADADLPHQVILWVCLGVSLVHCVLFMFVPESPSFLAAAGKHEGARASLAWLRVLPAEGARLDKEVDMLPPREDSDESPFSLIKELWSDRGRRRALVLSVVAVAGQECCGLLALLQFAELVLQEAIPDGGATATAGRPARHALILGAVQLVASAIALYLVERVGRKPLIVWTALICGGCLAVGAGLAWSGAGAATLAGLLGVAVAADSLGMQPAPYALLADMFHYRYRGCALIVATAAAAGGNALEVAIFGAVGMYGVPPAVALAAALTLAYAAFAALALPETRGRDPQQIYDVICPLKHKDVENTPGDTSDSNKVPSDSVTVVPVKSDDSDRTQWTSLISGVMIAMGLLDKISGFLGTSRLEAHVLVLGLDHAGKTALLRALRPPDPAHHASTQPDAPAQPERFQSGGVTFSAWDAAGAARHRALWERHYRTAHAIIFVVDAADHLRLVVAREELELALAHPELSARRLPLLVCANKCDEPRALPPHHVAAALGLERVVDKPWHICATSAVSGAGLADGLGWLARQLRDAHRPRPR
ncbi:probable metabolite transport protein CsbC, partial [Pectinophora gossypiella]|uniref:probable metabolite transport protein CsbC n=1 Tax=Pectinophora gossypiella TaxID=13191 RepID=UPI00214F21B2